jgi:AraC-like DNA-binding protein/ligand-binding sensor protein
MENARYEKMGQLLDYISHTYRVSLCFKDFTGFMPVDKELDRVLNPYQAHSNPFCMYIKSDRKQYFGCLGMMRPMMIKCACGKPFYGVCHAGVGEYVVPIKSGDLVLGAITAGFFPCRRELSRYLIKRRSRASKLIDYETACGLFDRFIVPAKVNLEEMFTFLEAVAEYVAATYYHFKDINIHEPFPARRMSSHEETVVSHAVDYIKQHFTSPVKVKDLAAYCYCSESYINHAFKKHIGMNLSTYVNKVRIEFAKNRLLTGNDIMTVIALDSGFNDPNYFCRVFTQLEAIPPSEWRRRYS